MIDWNKVAELRDEIGAEDFGEVVEIFLEEVDEAIGKMRADTDISKMECGLHFLKGSALNLGFRDFSSLCQTGETAAAAGKQDTVDIAEILACYDTSKQVFLAGLDAKIAD